MMEIILVQVDTNKSDEAAENESAWIERENFSISWQFRDIESLDCFKAIVLDHC